MLRIALLGSLAQHVQAFGGANMRTAVQWCQLPPVEAELASLDLIIYLKGDVQAERELKHLTRQTSPLTSIASEWESIPVLADLDGALQDSLERTYGFVVGYMPSVHTVCRWIRAAAHHASAALDLRILIVGETGTGKELVARAIHQLGVRHNEPFVPLNCGGLSQTLINPELFGHQRGAFTSAIANREGAIRRAGTGVLFLDEISDLPLENQTSFLRVLEQRVFSPVGSDQVWPLQAQVISATNRRLDDAVKQGIFRADLYFRIAQMTIWLPPLRERREDIPLLIRSFLCPYGLSIATIQRDTLQAMQNYDWPGNIRELRSVVEQFVLLVRSGEDLSSQNWFLLPTLAAAGQPLHTETRSLADLRGDFDRRIIEEVLARWGGNTSLAAKELGITRRSVYNLARRYGIKLGKERRD
jgi:transcriptional regulator with PAS, ATPase and Fis domain